MTQIPTNQASQKPIPPKPDNPKWKKRSQEEWEKHVRRGREEYARNYPRVYTKAKKELRKLIDNQPVEASPPAQSPPPRPGLSEATHIPFGPFYVRVNPHLGKSGVRHYFSELGFDREDTEPFIERYLDAQQQFPSRPTRKYSKPRKRNLHIAELVHVLVRRHPLLTARQLWNEIPVDEDFYIGKLFFYRTGKDLLITMEEEDEYEDRVQVGPPLTFNAFRKRYTLERKALGATARKATAH